MGGEAWPVDMVPERLASWLNERLDGTLMGHLRVRLVAVSAERVAAELPVRAGLLTPTGYVYAGA